MLRTGATVANLLGEQGTVWGVDRSGQRAIVLWYGTHPETVATSTLLTEPGRCEHGGRAGSPDRCDADTLPGEDYCPRHGGASLG